MDLQPELTPESTSEIFDFAEPSEHQPLELVLNSEASVVLEQPLSSCLPIPIEDTGEEETTQAQMSLVDRIKLELKEIGDAELQQARIQVGLSFVGFSALLLMFLLLYLNAMHPGLTVKQQMLRYWDQYIGFVCLGVAGMMMIGREAMRPHNR